MNDYQKYQAAGTAQQQGAGGDINYANTLKQTIPPRCECHDCTQARWYMSFQVAAQGNHP